MNSPLIEGYQVSGTGGAVAAWPPAAARIGACILDAGGNAMDAAAATALACSILAPNKTGIGGYVLAGVVLEGATGKVWSIDANAVAPAAAHDRMYDVQAAAPGATGLNEYEYQCSVRHNANVFGPLAVAVPGQLAGIGTLWERWGTRPWTEIVAPSQTLLDDGFPYGKILVEDITTLESIIRTYEPSVAHLMPHGKLPQADDIWHRPDMEKTLARLAQAGWRDFYQGDLAHTITSYLQSIGGCLTRQDMAAYQVRVTAPYAITYREAQVYGPILPNGTLTSLQILQMLECFPSISDTQPLYWHRLAEILKCAWRDRLRYMGDPAFTEVPIERLLDKNYAAGRVEALHHFPKHVDTMGLGYSNKTLNETLHLSTADALGNVVTATITQGGNLGSCVTVPGTGIILSHGMCRLDPNPGRPNSVAPGKRPLNNVAPMIIRLPERDVAVGLPGGRRIISVGAQLAQRVIDFNASPYQAAAAPRLNVITEEPLEVIHMDPTLITALEQMGHKTEIPRHVGGDAHLAEFCKTTQHVQAGGNGWAAAV